MASYGLPKINLLNPVRQCSDYENLFNMENLENEIKDTMPAETIIIFLLSTIPMDIVIFYMEVTAIYSESLAYSQVAYMACILSFLGGIRWGLTLSDNPPIKPNWINLSYSVTLPLIAWSAMLMPINSAIRTLITAHLGTLITDLLLMGHPKWYLILKVFISAYIAVSLFEILVAKLFSERLAEIKKEKLIRDCWWLEDEDPFQELILCSDDHNDVD